MCSVPGGAVGASSPAYFTCTVICPGGAGGSGLILADVVPPNQPVSTLLGGIQICFVASYFIHLQKGGEYVPITEISRVTENRAIILPPTYFPGTVVGL